MHHKETTPPAFGADAIYRPFFKAGIFTALTLGAVWGAILLLRIAFQGSFTAVGIQEVNAHGHAQIFGWVGLFVMGFAFQAFPRFKQTTLWNPVLAHTAFGLMVAGIVIRTLSQALLPQLPWLLAPGIVGSVLEITAIILFILVIVQTLINAEKPLAFYDYYLFSAMAWFLVQALYGTVYFVMIATAPDREALLALVAQFQAPLRDIQIHGFVTLMILGVSQHILHHFYGFPTQRPRRSIALLACFNIAVLLEVIGFILMHGLGRPWIMLWYLGVLIFFGAAVALVWPWRLYTTPVQGDRSLKFIRTAYAWLFLALLMLVLLPVYQFGVLRVFAPESEAAALGFSHAYYGATRHAITVGFISLMIMGVSARLVPTLLGLDLQRLQTLWTAFALINIGCVLRVSFQIGTDFSAFAFPIAGVSGLLEVSALSLWGVHLWGLMRSRVSAGSLLRCACQRGENDALGKTSVTVGSG